MGNEWNNCGEVKMIEKKHTTTEIACVWYAWCTFHPFPKKMSVMIVVEAIRTCK